MTLPDGYFDDVYRANDDPWHFETSAYEAAKYARTLAALPREHYARALEVGCSIGVFTARLAPRVDRLLSVDVSGKALDSARERLAASPQGSRVTFARRRLPDDLGQLGGPFDLIVLSEVLYYLSPADLDRALDGLSERLAPGGTLILVHWTPLVHDYPQTGDAVHGAALRRAGPGPDHLPLRHVHAERHGDEHQGYRLDVFTARD